MDFLQIASVHKAYGTPEGTSVRALDDVTINVRNNEFLTLLGPSGCGKTTLLKCIAGFEDLDGGDLILHGRSLRAVPAHRRPFNTVFQNYALFPHMTITQNVGYGLDVACVKKPERNRRVDEALEMVRLSGFGNRRPSQLSGGQQQRVALARSLVLKPSVLLLDEPLSALDRKMREAMQMELKNLQHSVGITFIFVTHDQEEALAMSDRIAVLSQGRLQQIGSPVEIYDAPANEFVANFVGTSNLFAGKVVSRERERVVVETANGRRLASQDDRFAVGDSVKLVLRPEYLHIVGPGQGEPGCVLEGTVKDTVFVGSVMHIHVDVGFGRTVTAHHRHDRADDEPGIAAGAAVRIAYAPAAAHLIAAAGA
ncbi:MULTISPECIES: ABC transporter ATP-binding protein [Chelativorans]|jgi:spermidine/putrescine transport system ATP-binding protein|uniref:Spermidine/putrescine import ATP-binding protein PotA n=1 Tax=Chelativorans sp. (strain BNC1) TaxID=266779 RepID=Q11MY2_CHESB|nr:MULTISPECIES: ABC transporter ATP-binding protein [Chelativorans]